MACMGENRNTYCILGRKPEGHRSLEETKRRWEDGIKIDLKQNCGVGEVWGLRNGQIRLRVRTLVGGGLHGNKRRIPLNSGNFLDILATICFSRGKWLHGINLN